MAPWRAKWVMGDDKSEDLILKSTDTVDEMSLNRLPEIFTSFKEIAVKGAHHLIMKN